MKNNESSEGLESEKNKTEMILSFCKYKRMQLSALEISKGIEKIFGFKIHKSEVNRLITKNLKSKISYNKLLFKYFINDIENPTINKFLSGIERDLSIKTNKILQYSDSGSLLKTVKEFFKLKYIQVKTGNQKIDYLIKTIVKDNKITECEEEFLISKAKELKYDEDIIIKAKLSLESNNPYLDDIIHIIFNDGKISSNELDFLLEKTKENHFGENFVCERFWIIGISEYSNSLRKINEFDSLLICFFVIIRLGREDILETLIVNELNVLSNNKIEYIIQRSLPVIKNIVDELLSNEIDFQFEYTSKILFENYKIVNKESSDGLFITTSEVSVFDRFMKILNQEKLRIGTPDVNLFVENIKYRIENKLWD